LTHKKSHPVYRADEEDELRNQNGIHRDGKAGIDSAFNKNAVEGTELFGYTLLLVASVEFLLFVK